MPQCCVPLCNSRREKDRSLSFYRLPADAKARKEWLRRIRREKGFKDTCHTRICSLHFTDSKEDGPQLFPWNAKKLFQVQDPEKQHKCRQGKRVEDVAGQDEDDAVDTSALEWLERLVCSLFINCNCIC